jgi:hypothetical protein
MSEVNVVIGPETVRSYKRLAYELWWAIAEFIDNSTQSYSNNLQAIKETEGENDSELAVNIAYDRERGVLRISDNAMGMSLSEIVRAVKIGSPPSDATGRHEFGMGMKTAACWLGDSWTLRTTKLGDSHEYSIEFDVERVASGDTDLRLRTTDADPKAHYTILEISSMHQKIGGRLLGRLRENLRSIYRFDTRTGQVKIWWGDEELSYDNSLDLLKGADGSEYRKSFSFEVNGKNVHGWAGLLVSGSRMKAGFAVSRRGRLIVGQPEAWRPQSLYGQVAGSNDLVNQRLIGEIHLDNFLVSHTKNQILWEGDDLDIVEEHLLTLFNDYKHTALNHRSRGQKGPSSQAQAIAIDTIKEIVSNPDFADLVNLTEVPAPEIVDAAFSPLRESSAGSNPDQIFGIGSLTVKLFMDSTLSPNDPYFLGDYINDDVVTVCVNTKHRFWEDYVQDTQDILIYTLNCIYDAIAEWKCMKLTGEIKPDTVKIMKNGLMRESLTRR